MSRLEEVNNLLRPLFNEDAFRVVDEKLAEFGFGENVTHLILNKFEGGLDTGKLMRKLLFEV